MNVSARSTRFVGRANRVFFNSHLDINRNCTPVTVRYLRFGLNDICYVVPVKVMENIRLSAHYVCRESDINLDNYKNCMPVAVRYFRFGLNDICCVVRVKVVENLTSNPLQPPI